MEQDKLIEEMAEKIKVNGDREVWLAIEAIGKVDTRVKFRKLFFEAGGTLDRR